MNFKLRKNPMQASEYKPDCFKSVEIAIVCHPRHY